LNSTVFLNGRFLSQPTTGVQRFSRQLLDALDRLLVEGDPQVASFDWVCLTPYSNDPAPGWKNIAVRSCGHLKGNPWEQIDLPVQTQGQVLVNLGNMGPFLKKRQGVVFHDASVFAIPQAYSTSFRLKHQLGLHLLGRTAPLIFTVSEFSRQEIAHYTGIKPEKIRVLAEGCEHIRSVPADPAILQRHNLGDKPYLLVISNLSPHKNLTGLVKALALIPDPPFEIVFAGITYAPVFQLGAQPLPAIIRQIGSVTDGELRALYEHAGAFIFPSRYEGFGLPPLEAMACGCPVIAARAASLPEVCGQAALYCDPLDPQDMADQIMQVMNDPNLRDQLRGLGLARAGCFTWKETARRFVDGVKSIS
jgi:glycosyltransferase involved in cell wall biosynthesis